MDRAEFAGVMAYLSVAVGKTIPRKQADVYFDLLGDLPLPALQVAAKRAVLESAYPTLPTVGTLRQFATEACQGPGLGYEQAWGLVLAAVRRHGEPLKSDQEKGINRGLEALPAAARRAAECIGWRVLCDMTTDNQPTVHAQFRDAYNVAHKREAREALLPAAVRALLEGVGKEEGERLRIAR